MDLRLPFEKTPSHWKNQARIAGEAGEQWCKDNINCPFCDDILVQYKANYPVKDFYCTRCNEEFQLKVSKSFNPKEGDTITSSSFEYWYESILDGDQPNLLILKYKLKESCSIDDSFENSFEIDKNSVSIRGHRIFKKDGFVETIHLVKKEDINEGCLVKRDKLSKTARRNGWEGSYLEIPGDKFTQIFPSEDQNVCRI